jgi:hypothetical protein
MLRPMVWWRKEHNFITILRVLVKTPLSSRHHYRWFPASEKLFGHGVDKGGGGQPVVVAVDAHDTSFKNYNGDLYCRPCAKNISHAMLLVGYNFEGGSLSRSITDAGQEGMCGMFTDAYNPINN